VVVRDDVAGCIEGDSRAEPLLPPPGSEPQFFEIESLARA
jgi:hypothetical protein